MGNRKDALEMIQVLEQRIDSLVNTPIENTDQLVKIVNEIIGIRKLESEVIKSVILKRK